MGRVGERERRKGAPGLGRESGQVLVWVLVALPLLLVLAGLVIDGGMMWAQWRRARWAADGAAVAAASEIDVPAYAQEGRVVLTENALYVANHYAQANYPGMTISQVYVQGGYVHVRGQATARPSFLSMVGVGDLRINVHAYERPQWGSNTGGQ